MRVAPRAALAVALAWLALSAQAQNPATALETPAIDVIATTPVPGLGTPVDEVPSPVRSLGAQALERSPQPDLASQLERALPGVSLSLGQGNAFQPELSYRGFSASPLLGAPQGVSLFLDGVRMNEPFGDTIGWDLIPPNAIATAHLVPGSNPAFGLNTLGAALSLNTKSGFEFPGRSGRAVAGSHGRIGVQAETGGHGKRADYFVAAQVLDDAGWREHSASRLRQLFAKTGWQDDASDIDVALALADNSLSGTQALPLSLLGSRRAPYTWPDRTENGAALLAVRASRFVTPDLLLSGNAYARSLEIDNVSSNINEDFDAALAPGPGNAPGENVRSAVNQRARGASLQLSLDSMPGERPNRLTVGAALDEGRADFSQREQEALFSGEREAVGIGPFAQRTSARTTNRYTGLYLTDHYAFADGWSVSAAGRYNVARLRLRDTSGTASRLDGDHVFRRFNPALGVTAGLPRGSSIYAGYNEGMRAPTPMELGCADPSAPCSLPNAFLADPPLKPVVARTLEAGWRMRDGRRGSASLGVYRTTLQDDIQFVASGSALSAGFFTNVGRSRRQGFEAAADAQVGAVRWSAAYARVEARYLSDFPVRSPNHSGADPAGEIRVRSGSRLTGVPADSLKLGADWRASGRWRFAANVIRIGAQYARGDDDNADASGRLPAYRVVNLEAERTLGRRWRLLARVDNVFDARYESFGVLGRNFFRAPGNGFDARTAVAEPFRTPGAARAGWAYVSFAYD